MDNEKEIPWLPVEEALFMQKYFSAREQEYIETAGKGYKALGIVNDNSKWLDELENLTSPPKIIII